MLPAACRPLKDRRPCRSPTAPSMSVTRGCSSHETCRWRPHAAWRHRSRGSGSITSRPSRPSKPEVGGWRVLSRSSAPGPDAVGGFPSSCRFARGCPGRESFARLLDHCPAACAWPLSQVWILPDLAENRLAKLAGVEKFDDLQEIVVAWPEDSAEHLTAGCGEPPGPPAPALLEES